MVIVARSRQFLNRPTHSLIQRLLWSVFGRKLKPVCAQWSVTLPPLNFSDHPTLCAASPSLLAPPPDWPPAAQVVGDLARATTDGELDSQIVSFLSDGPPPIYVGFGSMTVADPAKIYEVLTGLSHKRRIIFARGWSGVNIESTGNLLAIDRAPHDLLFPQMVVVVHHGGAGTFHAAARAGVPQVFVSFGGDQKWWAGRANAIGIAPPALSERGLSVGRLDKAIESALMHRVRAREIHEAMKSEDGCRQTHLAIHRIGSRRDGSTS